MTAARQHPNPGLDVAQLQALRRSRNTTVHEQIEGLLGRIDAHLTDNDGYLAFSGGKDSLVALHLALQVDRSIPVVFFDSLFEFPETYTYLTQVQDHFSIEIDVIRARRSTLQVLADSGEWDHLAPPDHLRENLHRIHITEPAAEAHQRYGPGELWGVRASESAGRRIRHAIALHAEIASACTGCCATRARQRATHGGVIRRLDGTTVFGPVWDWSTDEIWAYLHHHTLPTNPLYQHLRDLGAPEHFHRISALLDGSRLEHGRCTWLQRGWPAMFNALAAALPRIREFV